jgi:RimJ/RimL family protein N-acetyltransferase
MSRIPATRVLPDVATDRLELCRWSDADDAHGLAELNADVEVVRFVNEGVPFTRVESNLYSERIAAHWTDYGFGLWSARRRGGSGELLGYVGVCHPLWFPECAHWVEVGWRLRRDAWGRGYATEGGAAAIEAAFAAMPLERIVALIDPENSRSVAVAGRLGMQWDRRLRHPTRPIDVDVYAVGRDAVRRPG